MTKESILWFLILALVLGFLKGLLQATGYLDQDV
jgi:hypothetical protein